MQCQSIQIIQIDIHTVFHLRSLVLKNVWNKPEVINRLMMKYNFILTSIFIFFLNEK